MECWCAATFVILSISNTRAITFSRKTHTLFFKYKLGDWYYNTVCIKKLGVLVDSKIYFNCQVD
jgi:hypothetical protein